MASPLYDSIEIRETVDGEAVTGTGRRSDRSVSPAGASVAETVAAPKTKTMAKVRRADPYIWGIYLMLLLISVVELFSASSSEVTAGNVYSPLIRHGIFLVMGLGLVLWIQRIPYVIISKLSWVFAVVSLVLLVLSAVVGVEYNGAQRALRLAGMTIQPAEISKLAVVCVLATILGKNQRPGGVSNRAVITSAIVVVAFSAAMVTNGMTNMLLMMCVSMALMLTGGIQWRKMAYVIAAYAVGGMVLYAAKQFSKPQESEFDRLKTEQTMLAQAGGNVGAVATIGNEDTKRGKIDRTQTRHNRISNFFKGVHPDDPITDENRQVMLARFAQANGGLMGQGPGNSRESARLPLAFSDYIYSIIVEDTGFVGGALVLLLFLLMLARAGRIAFRCVRALPAFMILGCAMLIVLQALVHMAIVTGIVPVSGQPLPFISKGGTSVLVMSMAIGIMLSVSRFAAFNTDGKAIKAELNALPPEMQAENFSKS